MVWYLVDTELCLCTVRLEHFPVWPWWPQELGPNASGRLPSGLMWVYPRLACSLRLCPDPLPHTLTKLLRQGGGWHLIPITIRQNVLSTDFYQFSQSLESFI